MTAEIDWETAYDNRAAVPGVDDLFVAWAKNAAAFRTQARADLDLPYGDHPRERFDLFWPEGTVQGLIVFVHGGYWMYFSKDDFSHYASGALARGWAVAMPSYPVCPEVGLPRIARSVARAIEAAAAKVPGDIRLVGHSAGGHLVARMLNGDLDLAAGVVDRIASAVIISPVGDLRPLMQTKRRTALNLDDAVAQAESPTLNPLTLSQAEVTVWVGADELPAFLQQADDLASAWDVALLAEDGRHHFDVIDGLRDPWGPMVESVLF